MIIKAENDGELLEPNAKYLHSLLPSKSIPSPKDQKISAQAQQIRDFASRYLTTGFTAFDYAVTAALGPAVASGEPAYKQKSKKRDLEKINAESESLVTEFHKRVDSENADGDRIDEIAQQVIDSRIKKDHPGLVRREDAPHIILTTKGKIKRILNPDRQSKLKADYTITRNSLKQTEPKKK